MKQISFCITCMNRLKHLQETLEKNILGGHLSFLSPDIARWKLGRNGRGVSGVDYDIENYSDEYGGFRLVMELNFSK